MQQLESRSLQENVVADVLAERDRQDAKWGQQDHDRLTWIAILVEEVGESAEAILKQKSLADYRAELIQSAAVAVAAVECLDRDQWIGATGPDDPILDVVRLTMALGEFANAALHRRFGGHHAGDLKARAAKLAGLAKDVYRRLDKAEKEGGL